MGRENSELLPASFHPPISACPKEASVFRLWWWRGRKGEGWLLPTQLSLRQVQEEAGAC